MARADEGEGGEGQVRSVWKDHNLHVIFGVTLMGIMGTTSVTPAFPKIAQELGISSGQVYLLITVYTIPGILLTAIDGALSDRFGRRKILVPSLMLFGLAGGACAFVQDFGLLLALRTLQGVGAAGLGALNNTIIGDIYMGRERTAALGYNSSVLSIATASYPVIGGALATFGWFYPFALPLLAIPVGFLVLFSLRNPEPDNMETLKEYAGSVFESIKNWQVLGLFTGSLVTFIILFGPLQTYLPMLMDESFGASSLFIGLVLASLSLVTALTSTQLGWLTSYFSEKMLIRMSFVLYAAALILIAFIPSVWLLFVPMAIFGVAQSLNLPNVFSLVNKAAPDEEHRGAFIALNSTVLRLGQTLGPVLMAAAVVPLGVGGAYFAGAALAGAMFFVAFALIR